MPSPRLLLAAVALLLLAAPTRAHAEDEESPWQPERPLQELGGAELYAGFGRITPQLSNAHFSGSGRSLSTGNYQRFDATGKELGLMRPGMWQFEVGVGYLRRYLYADALFTVAVSPRTDKAQANSWPIVDAAPTNLSMIGGALGAGIALPIEPVTIRIGAVFGLHFADFDLAGYDRHPCGKHNASTCPEHATSMIPYVQPRISYDVALTNSKSTDGIVTLGGWFGIDAIPMGGFTAGMTVSVRSAHWTLAM